MEREMLEKLREREELGYGYGPPELEPWEIAMYLETPAIPV